MLARFLGLEGQLIKEGVISEVRLVMLMPVMYRPTITSLAEDPSEMPKYFNTRFDLYGVLPEEDGGPIAIYKQRLEFK